MKAIIEEIDAVTATLRLIISSFNDIQLNTVPFEGSWTAGQVGQHVQKSDALILKSLNTKGKTTLRQPDERVNDIKTAFLNFNTKFKSPSEIIPDNKTFSKIELLDGLEITREKINGVIRQLDLTETCVAPIFGEVTRLELVHFIISHTHRHIHQLKNIHQAITKKYQPML